MFTNCYVFNKYKNGRQKKWRTLISLPLVSTLYSNLALSEEQGLKSLGTLGGSTSSASWISADGSVVAGNALSSDRNLRAFCWTAKGNMQDLGTLGGSESSASLITEDDSVVFSVVAGNALSSNRNLRAFRWTASGNMQDLGTLGGLISDEVAAVNADGTVVVGTTLNKNGYERAFRWKAGDHIAQDLGHMGAQTSWAKGANADGSVMVGYVSNFDGNNHAFRWTARDKMQDLGTLGGSTSSASGTSADGNVVVGMANNVEGKTRAFRWTGRDNMQDLGTLGGSTSSASGISADGSIVVGVAFNEKAGKRAFIWKKNQHSVAENPPSGAIGVAATAHGTMLDVANTRASLAKTVNKQWQLLALNDARLARMLDRRCYPTSNTWCINGGISGRKGSYRQDISASLSLARQLVPGWYVGAEIDERLDGSVLQNVRTTTSVPAIALYTGWNQHPDRTGWNIAAGVGYVRNGTEVVRDYYENTERGKGRTQLSGKAFRLSVSNVFQVSPTLQITPYEELRYTASDRRHYYETGTAFNAYYDAMKSRSYTFHSGINITAQFNDQFATSIGGGVDVDLSSEKEGGEARAEYISIVSVPIHSLGRINTFGEVMVTYSFLQGMKLSLIADVHNNAINKQNSEATLSISKVW